MNDEQWCHYSDMPSPNFYKTNNTNNNNNINMKDKKHLGTIHYTGQISEYYHVRTKTQNKQLFHFEMVQITPTKTKTTTITESELPKDILNNIK